jgi:hypothetical protein
MHESIPNLGREEGISEAGSGAYGLAWPGEESCMKKFSKILHAQFVTLEHIQTQPSWPAIRQARGSETA